MAKDEVPTTKAGIYSLQQPEKLSTVLTQDKVDDCLSCRLTGAAAFAGLGAYSYLTGHKNLQLQRERILKSGSRFGMRSRQMGITGIAAMLVGMGFWRLVN